MAATAIGWSGISVAAFDEFGIPSLPGGGSGTNGRFRYTGEMRLSSLSLYSYMACMYSPFLGRFM